MTKEHEIEFDIKGMTCASCAHHVEDALKSIEGVHEVEVPGWNSEKATVVVDEVVDAATLSDAVKQAGYSASVKTRKPVDIPVKGNGSGRGGGFDLMVIGAGSAGFATAIKGAELGHKVALVGEGLIGGTCVNFGCVPSKNLIRAMEQYHLAGEARFAGVETSQGSLSWSDVIDGKDELVGELRQAKYIDVLGAYPDITYIEGRAHLTGGNGVEIDGETFSPGKIVIATGASPWAPPIPGLKESGYLDSTAALDLRQLPDSMIVLGANAVGLELSQIYARAGTKVTLLELLPRIAPFEDEDISTALKGYLEDEGLEIFNAFETQKVEKDGLIYKVSGMRDGETVTFEADQLLVATGRRPNTNGMGMEQAGVELGERGEIIVDDNLQTTNPAAYAAGDVTGRDMFVFVAAYAGGLAAENALNSAGKVYDTSYIPRVTFTDPQIASAGLTEAQALEAGYEVKVSILPMDYVPRALAARDTRGLIKLVADTATDRLLGAHVLAPEGGEIIQAAVLAIRFGLTVTQLQETIFPYLTNVEGLKLATLAFEKDVAMLSCCAG